MRVAMKAIPSDSFGEPGASQSFHSVPFVELRNLLPSRVDITSRFVDQLMRFISRYRVVDGGNSEIELALLEALASAVVDGNQEDPRKRVYVKWPCTAGGEISMTVEDEVHGFEQDAAPDPTSPDNRLRTNGRGIYWIRTRMDEVIFEQAGSAVRMRKRANAHSGGTRKSQ